MRVGVLASGDGSNLQAILDRLHGREGVEVVAVGSDKPEARALERARATGVDARAFPVQGGDRRARDLAIADWLAGAGVELVVLAGYMQLLDPGFLARFPQRVINVHPTLLPAFPGIGSIQQAVDYGVKVIGVTVHFVDEGVDSGPVILQREVPIPPDRDRVALENQVHATEHEVLPAAIRLFAEGRVRVDPENPRLVHIDSGPN